jgi:hypothetical protein
VLKLGTVVAIDLVVNLVAARAVRSGGGVLVGEEECEVDDREDVVHGQCYVRERVIAGAAYSSTASGLERV